MNLGVFCIGSNSGERAENINKGVIELERLLSGEIKKSDIYETPCALSTDKNYLNTVASGMTEMSLADMEDCLKKLEKKIGRSDECRKRGEVPVDIDIVIWNGKVIKEWDYRQFFFKKGFEQLDAFVNI